MIWVQCIVPIHWPCNDVTNTWPLLSLTPGPAIWGDRIGTHHLQVLCIYVMPASALGLSVCNLRSVAVPACLTALLYVLILTGGSRSQRSEGRTPLWWGCRTRSSGMFSTHCSHYKTYCMNARTTRFSPLRHLNKTLKHWAGGGTCYTFLKRCTLFLL